MIDKPYLYTITLTAKQSFPFWQHIMLQAISNVQKLLSLMNSLMSTLYLFCLFVYLETELSSYLNLFIIYLYILDICHALSFILYVFHYLLTFWLLETNLRSLTFHLFFFLCFLVSTKSFKCKCLSSRLFLNKKSVETFLFYLDRLYIIFYFRFLKKGRKIKHPSYRL